MSRHLYIIVFAPLALLLCVGQAKAQTKTIDYFNFNNQSLTNNAGGPGQVTVYDFDHYTYGSSGSGTTVGATSGTPAGYGLTGVDSASTTATDGIFELQTKTTGYNNLTLSFADDKSTNGYANEQLYYSVDDTNFTAIGAAQTVSTSYVLNTYNLSSIAALNNAPNVYLDIQFYNDGSSSYTGKASIDNLLLTGSAVTPAPSGVVSMGIGLGMVGLGTLLRRRRLARMDAGTLENTLTT